MMKQMNLWIAVLLISSFFSNVAQAQSVTADISATVSFVDDPYGVVPEIVLGETLVGQYTYETNTPDLDSWPEMGYYLHLGGTGYLNLSVGPYQVMTDTTGSNPYHIMIDDEYTPGMEFYTAYSGELLPNNGATFYYALMSMEANNNSALQSADLTATPPNQTLFNERRFVEFSGMKDGQYFYVIANMMEPEINPPGAQTRYQYRANAMVTNIYDPVGTLAGRVALNDTISAGFVYDQSTINASTIPEQGIYQHIAGTGKVSAEFAGILIETDPAANTPEVHVFNSTDPITPDHISVIGTSLISSDPTISAYEVAIHLDGDNTILNSVEMPADTLSLLDWQTATVIIQGEEGWSIEAVLTDLELVPAVVLFPADGMVHPTQRFDMALRVNEHPLVVGVQGINNGQDISPYLASCEIMPKLDASQSIVCPDTTMVLGAGANALQLQLMLEDGSILDTQVNWEVRE